MITPVPEHVHAIALKLATGEKSYHRVAQDLGLGVEYVKLIATLPQTISALEKLVPDAPPLAISINQRLEDLSQDALDLVESKMRNSMHERTALAAAKVILDARNTAVAAKGRGGLNILVLSDREAERMRETIFQIRDHAVGDGRGHEVGSGAPGTQERVPGEPVLSRERSSGLQGPSSPRTSPLLPFPHHLSEQAEA